jgi:tetratricopeptide (TPR) repeat protein
MLARSVDTTTALLAPLYWLQSQFAFRLGEADSCHYYLTLFSKAYSRASPETPVTVSVLFDVLLGLNEVSIGQLDSARECLQRAKPQLPSVERYKSTLVMLCGILESEILLSRGLPDSAIGVYRRTPVPQPSMTAGWRMPLYNIPRLRDVVPRAFMAKGALDSAIVAYEQLLKIDTSSTDRRLIDPRLHYRLALACERAGRPEQARAEYRRFLEIWKDADNDRPELQQAKKRLAGLGVVL